MTVLVTGGAGYIGSHMVHALADAGESVVVIDNLSTGFSAFLPEGVPLFIGDAGDENLVEGVIAQHGIESIIHFAGSVVVPDSVRDPLGYYRNNTMTTRSLLECRGQGRRQPLHLFVDGCRLRQSGPGAGARTCADAAGLALRLFQADDRNHAARCGFRPWHELCRAALLQRRRRRSERPLRPRHRRRHASAQDRGRSRHRAARQDRRVRHRLSDAGWKLHPRLHPCQRSRAGPSRRAVLFARRQKLDHAELRLRPRLFGARDHRGRPPRLHAQFRGFTMRRAAPATS